MHRLKIIALLGFVFMINSTFNACSEAEFSTASGGGSNKVTAVVDENIDEDSEVADLDDEYGVPAQEEDDAVRPPRGSGHACDKDEYRKRKVVICHVPPGNPEEQHTITVGWSAVRAHVDSNHNHPDAEHKDYFGDCRDGDVDYVVDSDDVADGDEEESKKNKFRTSGLLAGTRGG